MATDTFDFPPFTLDPTNTCLWRGSRRVQLSPTDFAVLHYLVTHPGQLVTHAALRHAVWPDTVISQGTLKVHLHHLRQVLGDHADKPRFIETVQRQGYRFIREVVSSQYPVASRKLSESAPLQLATEHSQLATRLVGRAAELAQLHQWLEKAQNGERQIVFVTGEAGIGKTTLVDAFVEEVQSPKPVLSPSTTLRIDSVEGSKVHSQKIEDSELRTPNFACLIGRGQCIEQYGPGEPYLPVLEALGKLCRGPQGKQLVTLLKQHAPTWLVQMPGLLKTNELKALHPRIIGATRERMLRELAEALEAWTGGGRVSDPPLLVLVLEDLHWSDASTVELLATLTRRREPARLLVVATYRPSEVAGTTHPLTSLMPELRAHNLCSDIRLEGWTATEVAAYVDARFAVSALPTRLAPVLHERTGGNPLFVVSLVQDWLTRGVLLEMEGAWTLQGELDAVAQEVPDTIRHLLMAQGQRLLPEEQRVLEAASLAGLEFSAATVAAALETGLIEVEEQCAQLAERRQFLQPAGIAHWPDGTVAARYQFLHALYQQLWHERVSVSRQQQWHIRIGTRKEAAYGTRAYEIATELAVHFAQGRDYPRAIRYLQQAGENAIRRNAYVESLAHFRKGLELLQQLPQTPEGVQQEFGLQTALGTLLIATKGYAAPEVELAYSRARELSQQMDETPQLFPVLWGLCAFFTVRVQLHTARQLAEQLLCLAHSAQDPALLIMAHLALGGNLLWLGEFAAARDHLEQGVRLYTPRQHHALASLYGYDPGMACRSYLSLALWGLGYPDQALKRVHEALILAQEWPHPYSLVHTLVWAAVLQQHRQEGHTTQEHAETAIALCRTQEFPLFSAAATILQGWALSAQQTQGEKMTHMRQGLVAYGSTGAGWGQAYYLALLAETYGKRGHAEEGLSLLAEALAAVNHSGERYYEAELWRLKGELTLQQAGARDWGLGIVPPPSKPQVPNGVEREAEGYFLKAIEIARTQRAKSLELRAVMSVSRLWQQQGKQKAAHRMLAKVYGWFTEGFDTPDLQAAQALLEALERCSVARVLGARASRPRGSRNATKRVAPPAYKDPCE